MTGRKVILYISMSVDGFIATQDDDLSWLSIVQNANHDYGYAALNERVDTYIVGRHTYEVVKGLCDGNFPPADNLDCYVITREERVNENGVRFYNGNIEALIKDLKNQEGKDIYCDGGGQIVQLLMDKNLIDEYIISVIPTILGEGKRLFLGGVSGIKLKANAPTYYDSGLVQLHYEKVQI